MHIPDVTADLPEVRRVLESGGMIACREAIVASSFLEPGSAEIDRASTVFTKLPSANGPHPELGKELQAALLAAGFEQVQPRFSFDSFGIDGDVEFFSGFIVDWFPFAAGGGNGDQAWALDRGRVRARTRRAGSLAQGSGGGGFDRIRRMPVVKTHGGLAVRSPPARIRGSAGQARFARPGRRRLGFKCNLASVCGKNYAQLPPNPHGRSSVAESSGGRALRKRLAALIVAGLLVLSTAPAAAATGCEFVLGFAAIKTLISLAEGEDRVGACLANESFNPATGEATQRTTDGLLTWRKADNWTAFSDGQRTWVNGPLGLQSRAAGELLAWERIARLNQNAREFSYQVGRPGGSINYASIGEPLTLNLAISNDASSSDVLGYLFEGLTEISWLTNQVEPALAESWDHSDDGLTWTFNLRRDVRWHDGVPFTARDVDFTFNQITYNDDIPASSRDQFTFRFIEPESGQWQEARMSVTAIDDYTVRFELPVSYAPFLRSMGTAIYPRHILEKFVEDGTFAEVWDIDTDPAEIIGTGPFKIERFDAGEKLVLGRNPDYWLRDAAGNPLPYLDSVNIDYVADFDAELQLFLAGEVDVHGVLGEEYAELNSLAKEGDFAIYRRGPAFGSTFLTFNMNPGQDPDSGQPYLDPMILEWFANGDFRRAAAHSIDRDAIIDQVLHGFGTRQWSSVSPSAGDFHNPDVPRYEYDPARARQILDGLGWRDTDGDGVREDALGNEISFKLATNSGNSVRERVTQIIAQGLADVGIRADVELIDFGVLVDQLTETYDWQAIVIGFTGGSDPYSGIGLWHSTGSLHLWHPNQQQPATDWEAQIDDLYVRASQELDHTERVALYHRAQAIAAENLPVIYTASAARITAVRNGFGNTTSTLYGLFDTRYLYRLAT
jgi:peptide/nickel transport system substrate-binding protein